MAASPRPDPAAVPTAPPWWKRLRAEPSVPVAFALGTAMVVLVFAIWWFVTRGDEIPDRMIGPNQLPSPSEVLDSLGKLFERHIPDNIIATMVRVFKGVGLAAVVGVVLGIAAGAYRGVAAALAPIIIFLRSVPMGALLPLTLVLFSTGEKEKTMFLFLAIVPFVFSDAVKAVSLVPERYIETALTLGATRWQIVRKVLVPLALPDIITSIRFQVGLGLGYIMLAEEIDTPEGLGEMINASFREGPREHVYLLLFLIAFIAFGIDLLLRTLQRGVFPWRRDL